MELDLLISKYPSVFDDKLGTMKTSAKLNLMPRSKPKFFRPSIEQELQRLEDAGIITKVSYSSWAVPIVAVPKKMGN